MDRSPDMSVSLQDFPAASSVSGATATVALPSRAPDAPGKADESRSPPAGGIRTADPALHRSDIRWSMYPDARVHKVIEVLEDLPP